MSTTDNNAFIEIDPAGDLTIKVIEYDTEIRNGNGKHRVLKTACFKVSRKTVIDTSKSQPLKAMLGGSFLEGHSEVVTLDDHSLSSVNVWLRYFHNALDDTCYLMPIKEVWLVLAFADQFLLDPARLNTWFETYWTKLDLKILKLQALRSYMYPAYMFDSAKGFAYITKALAYQSADHVTEINPTKYRNLHLDGNVIGSISGARGTLRGKLIRGLFDPVNSFLKSSCDCKEQALFAYNMGISKTGIWPLHEHHKKSVQQILDSPGFVKFECKISDGACYSCKARCDPAAISGVCNTVSRHFDGLCLDCMKMTKHGSVEADYWRHDEEKEWSLNCRIAHDQPTWYFSFMGRKTDMEKHQQHKKAMYEMRRDFYDL